jgi:hypothetical protein
MAHIISERMAAQIDGDSWHFVSSAELSLMALKRRKTSKACFDVVRWNRDP